MAMQAIDHNHGTQVRREVSLDTAQYRAQVHADTELF